MRELELPDVQDVMLEYRKIKLLYRSALKEIGTKLEILNDEFKLVHQYNPIEHIESRLKTDESITRKLIRKGKEITVENIQKYIDDIAGVRVICSFTPDIYRIVDMISSQDDIEVLKTKDYMLNPKVNGYRSYHLIIYYTVDTISGPKRLQAEIQIRTMAMNFWATIEHSLQYKYKGEMPMHVAERLSKAADAIIALDQEMSSVRNEIMDAQNSSRMQSNLVKDILSSIENLYKSSNKREVEKIQDEFLRVFRTKDLQQLERFHRQLDIIAEGYRAQSVAN